MIVLKTLFVFDLSAIILMIIIAYLSRRLGEALKIPAWYRILYVSIILVLAAVTIDALSNTGTTVDRTMIIVSMVLRTLAALITLLICLPYWKWLFAEYFPLKR